MASADGVEADDVSEIEFKFGVHSRGSMGYWPGRCGKSILTITSEADFFCRKGRVRMDMVSRVVKAKRNQRYISRRACLRRGMTSKNQEKLNILYIAMYSA